MGLNLHDRRTLRSLGEDLRASDPALARLVSMFTKLTAGEAMPEREQTRPRQPRAHEPLRWPRHHGRQASPAMVILVWLLLVLAVAVGVTAGVVAVAQAHCAAPGVTACAHPSPHRSSRPAG